MLELEFYRRGALSRVLDLHRLLAICASERVDIVELFRLALDSQDVARGYERARGTRRVLVDKMTRASPRAASLAPPPLLPPSHVDEREHALRRQARA